MLQRFMVRPAQPQSESGSQDCQSQTRRFWDCWLVLLAFMNFQLDKTFATPLKRS